MPIMLSLLVPLVWIVRPKKNTSPICKTGEIPAYKQDPCKWVFVFPLHR